MNLATLASFACTAALAGAGFAHAAERAIDKEIVVAAPAQVVWQSWTTKAGIESFFAPEAEIDAKVGGAFHIHINPFGEPGMKGADDMRFMALQAPAMLSFDWNAPPTFASISASGAKNDSMPAFVVQLCQTAWTGAATTTSLSIALSTA